LSAVQTMGWFLLQIKKTTNKMSHAMYVYLFILIISNTNFLYELKEINKNTPQFTQQAS
jgi:hypothetical protein